ncbi:hypothetical protein Tco_0399943 [Tanacetum coccineum]
MRSEVVVAVEWRLSWMVVMMVAHKDDGCGYRGGSRGSGWCVATTVVEMKRGGDMRRSENCWLLHGITDVWEDPNEITKETPATDVAELGQRMTYFVTTVRQDIDEIYGRLDDAQDDRLTQMVALQSQQRPARDPAHPDVPEEAGIRSGYVLAILYSLLSITGNSRLKMPPRRAPRTRTTPATATATTLVTDAAIKAWISRGVAAALAEREIQRNNNLNGDVSQGSRSGITRPVRPTRECTYTDFLKCQPVSANITIFNLYDLFMFW